MKVIITENQKNDLLRNLILTQGWEIASSIVGGPHVLAEMVFNNKPMEFLNLYKGVEVVRSEQDKDGILFRVSKGDNIMVLHEPSTVLYVSHSKIKSFLDLGFNMDNNSIRKLINLWMSKNHNEFVPSLFTSFDVRFPVMPWINTVL